MQRIPIANNFTQRVNHTQIHTQCALHCELNKKDPEIVLHEADQRTIFIQKKSR